MRADDLEARSETAKYEAENLATIISTASPDQKSTDTLKVAMRHRTIREISEITQEVEEKAQKEEGNIINWQTLGEEEVWIYFFTYQGQTGYGATRMMKESAPFTVAKMSAKSIWHMRVPSFLKTMEKFKQEILNGDYDEQLGTDTATLIYNRINMRG